MEKKEPQKESVIKEAFSRWLGLFLVIIASLAIFLIVTNVSAILQTLGRCISILRPVVYGIVIAYILNPLMKLYQELFRRLFGGKRKELSEKLLGIITGLSIACSLVTGILVIIILCWMVFPQLVSTLTSLINSLPGQINYLYLLLTENIKKNTLLQDQLQEIALNVTNYLDEMVKTKLLPWLQSDLLPNVNMIAVGLANGVISFVNVIYNLLVGIIVAIYLLGSKNTFLAQAKKIAYALFRKKYADTILYYVRITNNMFSGFISGKIVDSTIIGILCFFLMKCFHMPYAMLISVIIGVTNVIPVFGPYIGLIPSAFLILLANPLQALYFVIMIAILQQLDGNVIGPAILGESTGLSAFWVLFAILFFGGIWGLLGMLIGVPLFAVIYRMIADFINWKLYGKNLATCTDDYRNLKCIAYGENSEVSYVHYTDDELNAGKRKRSQKRQMIREKYFNITKIKKMISGKQKKNGNMDQ